MKKLLIIIGLLVLCSHATYAGAVYAGDSTGLGSDFHADYVGGQRTTSSSEGPIAPSSSKVYWFTVDGVPYSTYTQWYVTSSGGSYVDSDDLSGWVDPQVGIKFTSSGTYTIRAEIWNGEWVQVHRFTVKVEQPNRAPSVPTNLRVDSSLIDEDSAKVRWDASSDPDGDTVHYCVEYGGYRSSPDWTVDKSDTRSLYEIISNLDADKRYDVRVRAFDYNGGVSDWRKVYKLFRTLEEATPPSVPSLTSPSNGHETDDSTVSLDWSNSSDSGSGLDYYQVQVDNSSSFSSPEFNATPSSSSDTTSSLSDGKYYWKVRARDNAENWSDWSSTRNFRVDLTDPSVPVIVSPKDNDHIVDTTPYFDWNSSSDAGSGIDEYELFVEYKNSVGLWPNVSALENKKTGSSSSDYTAPQALTAGGRNYRWKVRAWDDAGNVSGWSNTKYFFIDDPVGSIKVTIEPQNAKDADAQWRLDRHDTDWHGGAGVASVTLNNVPVGNYSIEFKDISGWITPNNIPVNLSEGELEQIIGTYVEKIPDLDILDVWTEPAEPKGGQSCVIKAKVKNIGNADANPSGALTKIYVKFLVDNSVVNETGKDGEFPVLQIDSDEEKTYTSDSFTVPYKTSFQIKAEVDSKGTVTESKEGNNTESRTITLPQIDAAEIVTFNSGEGIYQYEDQVTVAVDVKNTGTTTRSFWVGLSFIREGLDRNDWPEGWYDVHPVKTRSLSPGQQVQINFTFEINESLRDGLYYADTAVWEGYNSYSNRMVEPQFAVEREIRSFEVVDERPGNTQVRDLDETGLFNSLSPASRLFGLRDLDYHLTHNLEDTHGVEVMNQENVVVLMHGWNPSWPGSVGDPLNEGAFGSLTQNLLQELAVDWSLVHYDWADDANTTLVDEFGGSRGLRGEMSGGINRREPVVTRTTSRDGSRSVTAVVATIAHVLQIADKVVDGIEFAVYSSAGISAEKAVQHGSVLGYRLCKQNPNLEKVHLIAHSAGSWGIYSALRYLSVHAPDAEVQVTYLDPFIPGNTDGSIPFPGLNEIPVFGSTFLTEGEISSSVNYAFASDGDVNSSELLYSYDVYDKLSKVANYIDIGGDVGSIVLGIIGKDLLSVGDSLLSIMNADVDVHPTAVSFNWNSIPNADVWRINATLYGAEHWSEHESPVSFYAGSVLNPDAAIYAGRGWLKSLLYNEPQGEVSLVVDPAGGMKDSPVAVSVESIPNDAVVRYTIGVNNVPSDPTSSSPTWSDQPIGGNLGDEIVLKFKGFKSRWADSEIVTRTYTIPIPGKPEISVKGSGIVIFDGDSTPATGDDTDFGTVTIGNSKEHSFIIYNDGSDVLNLTGNPLVEISGTDASEFYVKQPSSSIAAGDSSTFRITFDPSLPGGEKRATIRIENNDTSESVFDFAIRGVAVDGRPPSWQVNPSSATHSGGAESGSFSMSQTQGADAPWTATLSAEAQGWVTIDSFTGNPPGGEVRYSVDWNDTGVQRQGAIQVQNASFMITQQPTLAPSLLAGSVATVGDPAGDYAKIAYGADGFYASMESSSDGAVAGAYEMVRTGADTLTVTQYTASAEIDVIVHYTFTSSTGGTVLNGSDTSPFTLEPTGDWAPQSLAGKLGVSFMDGEAVQMAFRSDGSLPVQHSVTEDELATYTYAKTGLNTGEGTINTDVSVDYTFLSSSNVVMVVETDDVSPETNMMAMVLQNGTLFWLDVEQGTGDGAYAPSETVSIDADVAADGYQFVAWTGSGAASVATPTTLTMSSQDITITATYEIIPPTWTLAPDHVEILGSATSGSITLTQIHGPPSSSWTAQVVSGSDWLNVTTGTEGTGSGLVIYSVMANETGRYRTGEIQTANKSFSVKQTPLSPAVPSNPNPVHNATDVGRTVTLSWDTSDYALGYEVWFAKGADTLTRRAVLSSTSYNTGLREKAQPFQWQVIAFNEGGSTNGAVWKFSTENSQTPNEVFGQTGVEWNHFGAAPWFAQTIEKYSGSAAMQSGAIGDGQSSVLEATVVGPGTLDFWWKVSSEENDFLNFYIGTNLYDGIAGIAPSWMQESVEVPDGVQTLSWKYEKDGSGSSTGTDDCGWLDDVQWKGENRTTFPLSGFADKWVATYLWDKTANEWIVLSNPEKGPTEVVVKNIKPDQWYWLCVMEYDGTNWNLAHGSWISHLSE